MQKHSIFLLFIMAFCSVPTTAQKAFKPIRSALKAGKPQDALRTIQSFTIDTTYNRNPRLYDYAIQAYVALNDIQNEKFYLKQKYDTVQLFTTVYNIYDNILRCDSVSRQQAEQKRNPYQIPQTHRSLLHKYYRNLCVGGFFFYQKHNYETALQYLTHTVCLPQRTDLWGNNDVPQSTLARNATYALHSAFILQDYASVGKFALTALQDTGSVRSGVLESLARTAQAIGDTTSSIEYLHMGLEEFPNVPFFFTTITDLFARRNQYNDILTLANTLLRTDTINSYFLAAKSLALINLGRYQEAISNASKSLAIDSTDIDAYYYIGASYYNLAGTVTMPGNMNSAAYRKALDSRRNYYQQALPFIETYSRLQPTQRKRWAPLLYTIYLALNEGDKFSEMEEIMQELFPNNE